MISNKANLIYLINDLNTNIYIFSRDHLVLLGLLVMMDNL